MKKRLFSLLMVLVLLMSVSSAALACKRTSPSATEMATLKAMVLAANNTVRVMVKAAQETKKDDVNALLRAVDKVNAPVLKYADKIGAKVICEVEYYWIDGRKVAVDPLKVINRSDGD